MNNCYDGEGRLFVPTLHEAKQMADPLNPLLVLETMRKRVLRVAGDRSLAARSLSECKERIYRSSYPCEHSAAWTLWCNKQAYFARLLRKPSLDATKWRKLAEEATEGLWNLGYVVSAAEAESVPELVYIGLVELYAKPRWRCHVTTALPALLAEQARKAA